jgi:undecaprenyl-diphosphatase
VDALFALDVTLRGWFASINFPALDRVMVAATLIGTAGLIWILLGLVVALWTPSVRGGVWQTALALGLTGLLVDQVLKPTLARERPWVSIADVRVIAERPITYSLPSGHAATAFAGAYGLSRLVRRRRPFVWALAILIALSRVYVGVHYPSDVLGGAIVGLACGAFVFAGTRWDD